MIDNKFESDLNDGMKKIFIALVIFTLSKNTLAKELSLECSFSAFKTKEDLLFLGSVKKPLKKDHDFDLEVPLSDKPEWKTMLNTLKISTSVDTPKQGWIGLAFSSTQNPNKGWASIQTKKSQQLILLETSGNQTIEAHCRIK